MGEARPPNPGEGLIFMKTIDEVKKELTSVQSTKLDDLKQRDINKLAKRAKMLEDAIAYLETGLNDGFCISELERLEKRLTKIDHDFGKWLKHTPQGDRTPQQSKSAYRSEMQRKKITDQIKFMRYITNG